jgi:hypothetical protein
MITGILLFIALVLVLDSLKSTARWNAGQNIPRHDPLADVQDADAFLIRKGSRR